MLSFTPFSRDEEIRNLIPHDPHVVILGAGASIAAELAGNGFFPKRLPSMANLIEVVGLNDLVQSLPNEMSRDNFENLFSALSESSEYDSVRLEIEERVYRYFSEMTLPEKPTIYDYLVCSLRDKDTIATFNWDPFLYQAWCRIPKNFSRPRILFLHGNVALGYSHLTDEWGPANMISRHSGIRLKPTSLLYPVTKKDYNADGFLKMQWGILAREFALAKLVTVFGYSAPKTDVEAINLLKQAWGHVSARNMEQFEIIDLKSEVELASAWNEFIHTHHYEVTSDFSNSRIAQYPRRTIESCRRQFQPLTPEDFLAEPTNRLPQNFTTLEELWGWYKPLIEAEEGFSDP